MAEFIRRHSLFFLTVLLLFVCAQLMSASIRNPALPRSGSKILSIIIQPCEAILRNMLSAGRSLWARYTMLLEAEHERDDLKARVQALEARNSLLVEFEHENSRLRELLNYHNTNASKTVHAIVVGRDHSGWIRSLTINKGSEDGIREGMAVVDGHAVVGQITVVSPQSSKVLLITDHSSALGAMIQESRSVSIAEGNIDGSLTLSYLVKEELVKLGDRVITSGLDGVFSKGILIGVVTAIKANNTGLFQEVEIRPSVDFAHLEDVLVIVPVSEVS